ncbi:MAG: hypothetical protein SNH28_07480 [Rikenellaceae bacterium]
MENNQLAMDIKTPQRSYATIEMDRATLFKVLSTQAKKFTIKKDPRVTNKTTKNMTQKQIIKHFCKVAEINERKLISDNLQVGGYLDLRGTKITALPDNLQVGGSLDLQGTKITALPDNLQVGGYLDLQGGGERYIGADMDLSHLRSRSFISKDGQWIIADGIKSEVLSYKGNIYRVRKIARKELEYLITDGVGNWAHGKTLEEAKEDLLFKVNDRKKGDYEGLTADSELSHEDAIKCYRVITGACSAGTKHFVQTILGDGKQDKYTISEIAELTQGQYGHSSFFSFFNL